MTALHDLRTEAQNHPEGSAARRLMTWAEIHIGDQFDAITKLIADLAALDNKMKAMES